MEKPKIGHVFAMDKATERLAIRSFENTGNGELDFDEVLDEVCDEVGWDCVWAVNYGDLTLEEISETVAGMKAYADGGDDGWCEASKI